MKSMTPNDFGNNQLADTSQRININDLVRITRAKLQKAVVQSQIEALGVNLEMTISKTGFGGERLWFKCPNCECRIGVLYKKSTNNQIGCRKCLGIKYRKSRYKGMIEEG